MLFRFFDGFIVRDRRKAIDAECIFDGGKIEVKEIFEDAEIVFCEVIDTAVLCAAALCRERKGVFICDEHKGEIIVPKVFVKAGFGGEIKEFFDLTIDAADERGCGITSFFEILENFSKNSFTITAK